MHQQSHTNGINTLIFAICKLCNHNQRCTSKNVLMQVAMFWIKKNIFNSILQLMLLLKFNFIRWRANIQTNRQILISKLTLCFGWSSRSSSLWSPIWSCINAQNSFWNYEALARYMVKKLRKRGLSTAFCQECNGHIVVLYWTASPWNIVCSRTLFILPTS